MRLIRVFPRRTRVTPDDPLALCRQPDLFDEADEVHVSVTFSWDRPVAEKLAEAWRHVTPVTIGGGQPQSVVHDLTVRRLTPRECERLMGFPEGYTHIEWRRKPAADTPRYKALGNSMAVPVMRWIGQKIDAVLVYQAVANEPQRKLPDCLCAAYRKGTGLEPGREPSNPLVVDAFIGLLTPDAITDIIDQIEAFLTDKPYLFDRIRERSGRRRFFRQPAVLLAYFLAYRMPSQTRERWPLNPEELAPLFSDLGASLRRG